MSHSIEKLKEENANLKKALASAEERIVNLNRKLSTCIKERAMLRIELNQYID